jgi:xanthine dehydrogenase accessory factor
VLVEVEGSAPFPAGASMTVGADGSIDGSITAGCVESAVVQEAEQVLAGGPPRILTYGVSDELAGTTGLMCGGTVHVFVHALSQASAAALEAAAAAAAAGRPAVLATVLDGPCAGEVVAHLGGAPALSAPSPALPGASHDGPGSDATPSPSAAHDGPGSDAAPSERVLVGSLGASTGLARAIARDAEGLLGAGGSRVRRYGEDGSTLGAEVSVHLHAFATAPSMLLFGAVDFSAALAPLARAVGYAVTISDPRARFAAAPRFARAAEVHVGWPEAAFAGRVLGPRDAVLVFSHDPRLDVPALRLALATGAGYVGALGSRRTTAERERRLREAGVGEAEIARIHAPAGLDIGGATPEETAVSILAEAIAVRAARPAAPLRRTTGTIRPRG